MVRPAIFGAGLLAVSLLGAGFAAADEVDSTASVADTDSTVAGSGDVFFGFDEDSLRRDIAGIAYLGASQPEEPQESDSGTGLVFLGGGLGGGGLPGFWDPVAGGPGSPDAAFSNSAANWTDRIQIGLDWRPDLGVSSSPNPRTAMRYLAGSEPDRVGLRADLTAVLFDGSDPSQATAWRITGMLGSTSVSLAPGTVAAAGAGNEGNSGLMWDIGVGWSSGPVSLNAGYLSTYTEVDGVTSGMAALSFGADYVVLPGLMLYGEMNVVDDLDTLGDERLGTVFIVGTGLNF